MQHVTVKLGKDAYLVLKTAQYSDAEEIMEAIVKNKKDFLHELFGGNDMVEDFGGLEQIKISAIWD